MREYLRCGLSAGLFFLLQSGPAQAQVKPPPPPVVQPTPLPAPQPAAQPTPQAAPQPAPQPTPPPQATLEAKRAERDDTSVTIPYGLAAVAVVIVMVLVCMPVRRE